MKAWLASRWRQALAFIMLVGALVGIVILIWRLIVAPFHGNTGNANVTAGALALTGVLVTATVSVVGLSLKQSIDRRTLELSQAEHARQQMETAMQTVRLLTLSNGDPAPKAQISAALLVLARLGEVQLALDLAGEMWPKGQLASSVAVRIIGAAFGGTDPRVQRDAAILLLNNVTLMDTSADQYEWPVYLEEWPVSLDSEARVTVALAIAEWIKRRKPENSEDRRLGLMGQALKKDPDPVVKQIAKASTAG